MKRFLAMLLSVTMVLSGCSVSKTEENQREGSGATIASESELEIENQAELSMDIQEEPIPSFSGLNDPKLLQHIEDSVYCGITNAFHSEDYIIENISASYVSKEYLDEVAYNSQANIWFGYTLAELDQQFQGKRYVFSLDDNYETIAVPFEDYDDTYDKVIRNVIVGTGVILLCVTVSAVSAGVGAPAISLVFAASAKTATTMALTSGGFSAIVSATITGYQTGDLQSAIKNGALQGSEAFKWGAITGAVVGGITELSTIRRAKEAVNGAYEYAKGTVEIPDNYPQWRQAELRALNQSGGYEQLSYLNGEQVPFGTPGATRPDVVKIIGDHLEAIEVKYYDLESSGSLGTLYSELEREITARVANLPAGSTQKIILDVTGRGFSEAICNSVKNHIWELLADIYPNIPIEIVGLL